MEKFEIGDTVQILAKTLQGSVGTVVHRDVKREKYLVRVDATIQNYYSADEIAPFNPR